VNHDVAPFDNVRKKKEIMQV